LLLEKHRRAVRYVRQRITRAEMRMANEIDAVQERAPPIADLWSAFRRLQSPVAKPRLNGRCAISPAMRLTAKLCPFFF
jgi:hypothetical protein